MWRGKIKLSKWYKVFSAAKYLFPVQKEMDWMEGIISERAYSLELPTIENRSG
jgi:hypothetical protein